ncbi:hypothetical protein HSX11_02115 [Oxalobacteraceae bacterium]|nr:hypothetical protein [Oxalobacteraceae bacterium]
MNETKIVWIAGVLAGAAIGLLIWRADSPATSVPEAAPPIAQQPVAPASVAAAVAPPRPDGAPAAQAPCSEEQLRGWTLMSVGVGAYREDGFAVLYNAGRGTLTVREHASFDGALRLLRVSDDAAELGCGDMVLTRRLASARQSAAEPEMRTALPAPQEQ